MCVCVCVGGGGGTDGWRGEYILSMHTSTHAHAHNLKKCTSFWQDAVYGMTNKLCLGRCRLRLGLDSLGYRPELTDGKRD